MDKILQNEIKADEDIKSNFNPSLPIEKYDRFFQSGVLNPKGKIDFSEVGIDKLNWKRLTALTSFSSLDGFHIRGIGSTTVSVGFLGTMLRSGNVANDFTYLNIEDPTIPNITSYKNSLFQVTVKVVDPSFAEGFLGIYIGSGWPMDNTAGVEYVGFSLKNNEAYAVSRKNGVVNNSTPLGVGISISDFRNYRFEIESTSANLTKIKFYVNEILKAEQISNLPNSLESADIFLGVKNWNAGGNQDLNLLNLLYSQDFH